MVSVVINTLNEEKNIKRCLESAHGLADELVVCDDGSIDKTIEIAKKFGAKIYHHKSEGFVEAARNFGLENATSDWILIVDADEEIPKSLAQKLEEVTKKRCDFVRIPRKNIIFGKWITHSGWWPDYNVRFFKKDKVTWSGKIHEDPKTEGRGFDLPLREDLAIIHHNYNSINQYLNRLSSYTEIEAQDLVKNGYKFDWRDLISKPTGEFLSRFFAQEGYKDGLHGLALSLLQAFSFLIVYLKVWERGGFEEKEINLEELKGETLKRSKEFQFWILKMFETSGQGIRKILYKLSQKF